MKQSEAWAEWFRSAPAAESWGRHFHIGSATRVSLAFYDWTYAQRKVRSLLRQTIMSWPSNLGGHSSAPLRADGRPVLEKPAAS